MEKQLTCDVCGTTENVHATIDPYAYEIDNEEIEMDLCDYCENERREDI